MSAITGPIDQGIRALQRTETRKLIHPLGPPRAFGIPSVRYVRISYQ